MTNNITPGHVRAFQAVTTGMYGETSLWSCRINGEEGVALVLVDQASPNHLAVMPLFVAITEGMKIEFDGESTGGGGGGGGPKDPRGQFEASAAGMTAPSPA